MSLCNGFNYPHRLSVEQGGGFKLSLTAQFDTQRVEMDAYLKIKVDALYQNDVFHFFHIYLERPLVD